MAREAHLTPRRFATEDWPERERLSRWREEFGRTLVGVDIVPSATDVPFWAEALLQTLPGVNIAMCAGSSAVMDRTPALVATDAHAGDTIGLILNLAPTQMPVWQHGGELMLAERDAVLVRHDEACAIATTRHIGLLLPRAALAERVDDLDSAVMKQIPRDNQALRMLFNYIQLVQSDSELTELSVRRAIVDHVHDLAALMLGANRDTREHGQGSVDAARVKQTIAYINRHFADPDVTIVSIAEQQGVSPRYLHDLLEQSGASFTARINELRLKRALALLTRFPDRRVSEVAAQVGFSSVSAFDRLFRVRFGDSPGGVRKTAPNAPSPLEAIAKLYRLTATELRVLDTLLRVNGVRAMAATLGLSQATVKTHLHNLFRKTGTARQSDLVKLVAGI